MIAFLKFIFYFFLTLFLLGLIGRIILRLWLRRLYKKINQETGQQSSDNSKGRNFSFTRKKKIIDKNQGEYVDYEELD
ncbi:MAG: DUF4834 family protein [Tenuifilum sp.]|jgi:hypothetical protein|uniref:DUF4834 family protein n=1 Tax=Tenuifilum sp. TaxID=2760880 RepID=UPI001B6001E5|nr:hypothetical protein [Bacteroidales bacterium]HOK60208.1 hypothetical protein [Tenuifilum sp.]MBP9028916.1 hypothetical protein [Bacteroidales bacterium]HOK85088.1 hypothetical protein [Tenuifilum sp.]HON70133.1 hypothetical protein [Tenuifilum sp.]